MGDIEDLKQAIQRDFVTPLREFRAKTQALDTLHDQCVKDFQDAIGSLFGPGVSFSGSAADALANLVGNYLSAEQALSDYAGNSLSDRLSLAAHACENTVASMEPTLASLHDLPGVAAAGAILLDTAEASEAAVVPGPENPLWDVIVAGGLIIATGAFVWEQSQQQMNVNALWQDIQQWKSTISAIAQQPESVLPSEPDDPKPFTLSPSEHMYAFTNLQPETVRKLADEYGVDVADILRLLAYNPNYTEQELRAILERYRRKQAQYSGASKGALLLALAMNLPDTVLAYLTHLNDKQTNLYLKGNPEEDIHTDVLAALLGQLTLDAKRQFTQLQAAARKGVARLSDDDRKDAAKKEQAIIDAVEDTGVSWKDLPLDVRNTLLGRYGREKYHMGYGKSIEALVKQNFASQYQDIRNYYIDTYDLEFNESLPGRPDKKPDVQIDAPTLDIQITEDGKKNVLDITSKRNMPDKQKYNLSIVQILIALGY